MTEAAINPLRRRMIEDMTLRNLSEGTQRVYIASVRACCRYCNKKPDELTFEDVRTFRLQLTENGLAPGSVNGAMVGLRFFFRVTLGRPKALDYIPMAREPQRLPTVLSASEVARLLEAAPGLKWRTALSVAYGAGLRASEVVALKVGDIHSERMRIRVEQGKGRRDRDALLSPQLLRMLRDWWKTARPQVWLFPNRLSGFDHVTPRSLRPKPSTWPSSAPGSKSRRACTPCGTVSPPTSWSRRWTSAPSRSCSATGSWRPRRSTPTSRPRAWTGSPVRSTCWG
jgi:integrase